MNKRYSQFLVYVLSLRMMDGNSYYYVGAHARPSQKYLTEKDILNFSGNPLTRLRQKGELTVDEYMDRIKILFVEEYEDMDSAYFREKELIVEYKKLYGDICINKTLNDCHKNVGRHNTPESNAKRSATMTGRKLSQVTKDKQARAHYKRIMDTNTGKVYESLIACAKDTGLTSSRISYGIVHNSPLYSNFKYV